MGGVQFAGASLTCAINADVVVYLVVYPYPYFSGHQSPFKLAG